jgi:hypothetical protein
VLPLSALAFGSVGCTGSGIDEDADSDGTEMDTDSGTEGLAVQPIIGNWDATFVESGPYSLALPIEYTLEDGTDSYTSVQSIALEVTPTLASLVHTVLVTDAYGDINEPER